MCLYSRELWQILCYRYSLYLALCVTAGSAAVGRAGVVRFVVESGV